ncbi:TPA: hypothetical protein SLP51_005212, partial [Klebsiella aerogenes]|nr:hypothetical protein [Klebsiella aerogenes]
MAVSFLSAAVFLALCASSSGVRAAPGVIAGSGENKTVAGDIAATAIGDAALKVHDGGVITGQGVSLSSQFNALIRASDRGRVELDGVTLSGAFGPQAYIESGAVVSLSDATFAAGDVWYVDGEGSQLLLKNAVSSASDAAFDIRHHGSLQFDNVRLEGRSSASGAAMIRAASNADVTVTGSRLTSHDNAVLKLSDGARAVLRDSKLATYPEHPENTGYYPVVQLNKGTAVDADNVDLSFAAEGSALSLDDEASADIRNSRITGSQVKDEGAAVDVFGRGSQAIITNTDVRISGDMSAAPGRFMGVYGGTEATVLMQGGSITTEGVGLTGLQADYARVELNGTTVSTQQDKSVGVLLYGASGTLSEGAVLTQGENSPAIAMHDRGNLT